MSGTPNKRLHEDVGGHSSPLKNPHETKHSHEESTSYPSAGSKLASSVMNEYRASSDMGLDARTPKVPRTELREADKSPLVPMYRISSASHDSRSDLPPSSENKFETKESKDSSKDTKSDNRVLKTESRDLYQNVKVDKDSRSEVRGDDNKETKQEREPYGELKSEMKTDKEVYSIGNNQSNWKESKEHYRAKRYSDSTGGNIDTWHASRAGVHGPAEFGMESSTIGKRDQTEAHEAAGENSKSDDKFKDKDRKRKEGKHRESGESNKDRSERRSSNDGRESVRDEKEAENYDRERKDTLKDKDKSKEREKDYCKRDSRDGADKEVSQNEIMDVSGRVIDQSISAEHPIQKDHHGWKSPDKEAKGGKKEKDSDFEGDRCEKRGRCYDKESDDGCVETEGGAEKERDAFSYGVQQRKRMLRPRGSPQMGSRDPQSKSRAPENEGSQGKPEVSIVTYKVGECLQDLIRLWKEYESSQAEKTSASLQSGPTLEIRIPAEHVTATNRQVRGGQLWGSDIYTNDSDLVAVLMHTGYCRPTASPPPSAIQELRAVIRVLPPQDCYFSTLRNSVRSRSWGSAIGCSYRVERCCIIKKEGGAIDLEPCLTHTSTIEPTLAPMIVERTMTTRAAASNALRQQRFVREVTIQYNLCNEPWTKYSISAVADKGLKKPLYTSARLKKGEVLYLETHSCRYELCFSGEKMVKTATAAVANPAEAERSQSHYSNGTNGEKSLSDCENGLIDVFRWSRCKKPLPQKFMCSIGIPLPLENVEVLEDNLEWEDIEWSQTGVYIAGKEYTLARVHFLSPN